MSAFANVIHAGSPVVTSNWVAFKMDISRTNFTVGDPIVASVTISNTSAESHWIEVNTVGNPCAAGDAKFLIFEVGSGKQVQCAAPREQQAGYSAKSFTLGPHDTSQHESRLGRAFAITNAGLYSVRAVCAFNYADVYGPKFTLTTPPIVILLSPSTETNLVVHKPRDQ
jgi:hypothetical protein